jgi:hypothetical protein
MALDMIFQYGQVRVSWRTENTVLLRSSAVNRLNVNRR